MLWALYWVLLLILPHAFVLAAPGSCSYLSADQLQSGKGLHPLYRPCIETNASTTVPGWLALQTAVEATYGTEPYKVVVNDSQVRVLSPTLVRC
jgi:hypothetical protein